MSEHDIYRQGYPVCPYCGQQDCDFWDNEIPEVGEETKVTCTECGKEYWTIVEMVCSSGKDKADVQY